MTATRAGAIAATAALPAGLPSFGTTPTRPVHAVQFYESDAYLGDVVAQFVASGFDAGDAIVVIATEAHRRDFSARLAALGFDVEAARGAGRFLAFDAVETVSQLLEDGWPDQTRFRAVVGTAVASAARGGRTPVRAFGEMVAVLCRWGMPEAAVRLEQLWNDLASSLPFTLLCAYPVGTMHDGARLAAVCAEHGVVIPAESYHAHATVDDRLHAIVQLQRKAQALEIEIEHRKAAERALRAGNDALRALIDASPVPIVVTEADGTVRVWNPAAEATFGWTAAEVVGRPSPLAPHVLPDRNAGRRGIEMRRTRRDGARVDVVVSAAPLAGDDGVPPATVFVFEDVTARNRAEAEREELLRVAQRARAEAETANRAKDEFLSVISHELRTPLASILGWTNVLRSGITGPRAERALETIERGGQLQAKLIDDLLDVSRIVAGGMRLDVRPVDFLGTMRDALDAIRPAADAKGVRVWARLEPVGLVDGDRDRLQQIAWNLLSNAVKFTPAGGLVEMLVAREGNTVRVVVRDTGRGIAPDFLPFVFDRFRQADRAASRRTGGLGLGLAIVRHLVALHGGTITVASEGPDRGSEFAVALAAAALQLTGRETGT